MLALLRVPDADGSMKAVWGATNTSTSVASQPTHHAQALTRCHSRQIVIQLEKDDIVLRHSFLIEPPVSRIVGEFEALFAEVGIYYVDSLQICGCYCSIIADGERRIDVFARDTSPYAIGVYRKHRALVGCAL